MVHKTRSQTVILIPAYQPEQKLVEQTNALLSEGFSVVVVDDGSGQEYARVFDRLSAEVKLLRHHDNKGKGAALKTGYAHIDSVYADYVIVTADADGQHSLADIKKIANQYQQHKGSLLLGARQFEGAVPLRSKVGNWLTQKIMMLVTLKNISDTQTGLRAFDQSLTGFMLTIPGERFSYETNVLLESIRQGVAVREIPITTIYENDNASSHFNPITDSLAIYKQIALFASSSIISFVVDYVLFVTLLHFTDSLSLAGGVVLANVFARIASATLNFSLNKTIIFKHKGGLARGVGQYIALAAGILLVNTLLLSMLTGLGVHPYLAKIVTEVLLFLVSYIVQRNIIFTQKEVRSL